MVDLKELPGYKKKSFTMAFRGGEIWVEHLDDLFDYENLVIQKLLEDCHEFCRPSSSSQICMNVYNTNITDKITEAIIDCFCHTSKRFTRICVVGANRNATKKLKKAFANQGFTVAFIDDFEKAKEWCVGEGL